MRKKTVKVAAPSETLAATFLRRFFTPRQVLDIKRLEHEIWSVWKTDPGRILRRVGYGLREQNGDSDREKLWRFFFVKELRFEMLDGWRRAPDASKFERAVKRYQKYRGDVAKFLNPAGARVRVEGEEGPLKTALSPIDL